RAGDSLPPCRPAEVGDSLGGPRSVLVAVQHAVSLQVREDASVARPLLPAVCDLQASGVPVPEEAGPSGDYPGAARKGAAPCLVTPVEVVLVIGGKDQAEVVPAHGAHSSPLWSGCPANGCARRRSASSAI